MHHWALLWAEFSFFLHGCRILWNEPPRIIWYIGVCSFSILAFLVLFFELTPQPEVTKFFFINIPTSPSYAYPLGAGLVTSGGVVIYSTNQYFLESVFSFYCICVMFYAYLTLNPPFPTKNVLLAKKVMIIACVLVFVWGILSFPWTYHLFSFLNSSMTNAMPMIAAALMAFNAIFIPESMLISQAQITRIIGLYDRSKLESEDQVYKRKSESISKNSLNDYIKAIQKEISTQNFNQFKDEN